MDAETALTGLLPAVVLVSTPLSLALCVLLLRLYRRAVLRGMRQTLGHHPQPASAAVPASGAPPSAALDLADIAAASDGSAAADRAQAGTEPRFVHALAVHAAAAVVYAVVMALTWTLSSGAGVSAGRLLWLVACFSWPGVVLLQVGFARDRRDRLRLHCGYASVLAAVGAFVLLRNPGVAAGDLAVLWALLNLPATVLAALFLRPRLRAVGPLVLALVTLGVTGALLLAQLVGLHDGLLRAMVSAGAALALGATVQFWTLQLLGALTFGALGGGLLLGLGQAYRRGRLSDQTIMLGALGLFFATLQSVTLVFEHPAWVLGGALALGAAATARHLGLAPLRQATEPPPELLWLRVFALGRRSEQLFDALSRGWRYRSPMRLICGPDLLQLTVEPHEFLDFLGGRLKRRFVRAAGDLQQHDAPPRLGGDGRYRVQELFCHADTWRLALAHLTAQRAVILMDLRGFGPDQQGCRDELEHLLNHVDLRRVLLLVDDTTDRALLNRLLAGLWQGLAKDSPNRHTAAPQLWLVDPALLGTRGLHRQLAARTA